MNPTPTIAWFDHKGTPLPLELRRDAWAYDGAAHPSDPFVRLMRGLNDALHMAEGWNEIVDWGPDVGAEVIDV